MLIQIDVDSTLYDADTLFDSIFREADIDYPKASSKWVGSQEIKYFDGTLVSAAEAKNLFRKAHSHEVVMSQKPYDGASEVIQQVIKFYPDVEITYISDRHAQSTAALKGWLEQFNFLPTQQEQVVATKDKRHWMRLNKPEVVIDDRVRTMLMARYELNASVIAYEQPHNVNLKNEADRIFIEDNWVDIGERLCYIIDEYTKGDKK